VATSDSARAAQAMKALAGTHAVTSAVGLTADIRRLVDQIACYDHAGILAGPAQRRIND